MLALGPRNILISFLVFLVVFAPGAILLRESDTGYQAVGLAAFGICLAVLNVLDARQRHREGRE
jgi:hypothetical protein